MNIHNWVFHIKCNGSVIPITVLEEINSEDGLIRFPVRIRPFADTQLKSFLWEKNGILKCECTKRLTNYKY